MPVRVRQHVNPLAQKYRIPLNALEWEKVYTLPNQPLHIDIGCAKGRFLLGMAQIQTNWNFLGLEIREPLVNEANKWRDELGLTNLHYLFCNVNNSLRPLLSSLPTKSLERITIQFPDPWFKTRHAKRRVVQPQLVEELADYLLSGGVVFLQSDIEFIAEEMCDRFAAHPAFSRVSTEKWLGQNPLPVSTEREVFTLNKGEPVYRAMFKKVTA